MIFGMTPFTFFHLVLSLVGIAEGFVVLSGCFRSDRMSRWTAVFLLATLVTVITGFLFYFSGFAPDMGVGIVTAVTLVAALNAVAPTGFEVPLAAVQGVALLAFLCAGYLALNQFHPTAAEFGGSAG